MHVPGLVALVTLATAAGAWLRGRLRRPQPLTQRAREVLAERVGFYAKLDAAERARFERACERFLADHTVTGPRGAPLDDELRILVAASATMLMFGRPDFVYPPTRDIVVYDEAFDADYASTRRGRFAGMVHAQGPILFSARALREGFARPRDGVHVGLHEFAHVLDFEGGLADGVPSLLPWSAEEAWLELVQSEMERIDAGRHVLGPVRRDPPGGVLRGGDGGVLRDAEAARGARSRGLRRPPCGVRCPEGAVRHR